MTQHSPAVPPDRGREMTRRAAVLALVHGGLAAGLYAFYSRQSLISRFSLDQVTRVWMPTASLDATPVANVTGWAESVPVLVYHGVVPEGETGNVTPETFQEHMLALKSAGYTTLTMDQFHEFMAGQRRVPERSVLVTFDDGRTDSFSGADPVLEKLGLHATMFTILGDARSGKAFYLTLKETEMMARTGRWDVHSHTCDTHVSLQVDPLGKAFGHALPSRRWDTERGRLESDAEWETRVTGDLTEARNGIAKLSGRPVYAFAYPWGDYGGNSSDPLIRRRLRQIAAAIYPITFTQQKTTLDETCNYPMDYGRILRRINVRYNMTADDLLERLERGVAKPLPYREEPGFRSLSWALTSGSLQETGIGRELTVEAGSDDRQAETFLDGSRAWRDYAVTARFPLDEGESVGMVARRLGPGDYLTAIVQQRYLSIEQTIGAERTTIAEADLDLTGDGTNPHDVAFSVRGQVATVKIDGRTILRAENVDPSLTHGGIGFRTAPLGQASSRLRLEALTVLPFALEEASNGDGARVGRRGEVPRQTTGG